MKSKVKENIGYIAIAIVLALTLVLSVVAIDTYQNNGITALAYAPSDNSIYIYPNSTSILPNDYNYLSHYYIDGWFGFNLSDNTLYEVIFYIDGISADAPSVYLYGFFVLLDGYTYMGLYDWGYADIYCNLEVINDGFYFYSSPSGYFDDLDSVFVYDIREVNSSSDSSTTDSFLSLIGDGITFGFDSIATGITYTMDNLFIVDGELTNFSVVVFLMTGISLALSVLKFVLNFIFSFGGKD